jgi:hypothetical protein
MNDHSSSIPYLNAQMSLIDKYISQYHFKEYHKTCINAGQKECFLATKALDMNDSFLSKTLMKLRGLPVNEMKLEGFLKNMCFTYTEEDPYTEFIIDASQKELDIFWNFRFEIISPGKTLVSTETRVYCLTPTARKKFRVYWFFIRPFSGIIRKEILRLIKKKSGFKTQ